MDRLRVSLWAYSVLLASGFREVQQLDSFFDEQPDLRVAHGLWSKYIRGEVLPQQSLKTTANSLITRVAGVFPQTENVFHTPVWALLPWEPTFDPERLRAIYLGLDSQIHVHFVAPVSPGERMTDREPTKFWHLRKTNEERRRVLKSVGPWETLVVSLLEARMGYAAQLYGAFADSQLLACQTIARLQLLPQFEAKRPQGVLLTMEAVCFDALLLNIVRPQWRGEAQEETRSTCMQWILNWSKRCEKYAATLAPGARTTFLRRLKHGTEVGLWQSTILDFERDPEHVKGKDV